MSDSSEETLPSLQCAGVGAEVGVGVGEGLGLKLGFAEGADVGAALGAGVGDGVYLQQATENRSSEQHVAVCYSRSHLQYVYGV